MIEQTFASKEVSVDSLKETVINESPVKSVLSDIENRSLEALKYENSETIARNFDELAPQRPLYELEPKRLDLLKQFEKPLSGVIGLDAVKQKTLSLNVDSARGSYAEIVRAFRTDQAGLKVEEIGKQVETNLGKTDIDILAKSNKNANIWIENKDVKNISATDDFKTKIDKMADGLKNGVKTFDGSVLTIEKAVFVNHKSISANAIEYAKSKGVHIKENMSSAAYRNYIQRI